MTIQKMSRQIMLLRIMLYAVMVSQVGGSLGIFLLDENIYLEIEGTIWQQKISEFQILDQLAIGGMMLCSSIVLLYGLFQLIFLCRVFDKGSFFTKETIRYCKLFSISIMLLAVIETVLSPILLAYLWLRDAIPEFPEISFLVAVDMLHVDTLAFGFLFYVMSKIMETGFEMKNELELTI